MKKIKIKNRNSRYCNLYLKEDGDNFYKLNLSILDKIGIFNDNIIDTLKEIFIGNNILKSDKNKDNINENVEKHDIFNHNTEEESEIFDKEKKKDIIDEVKEKSLSSDEYNLILGDDFILRKLEKRKNRKKVKSTESENILDDLEI